MGAGVRRARGIYAVSITGYRLDWEGIMGWVRKEVRENVEFYILLTINIIVYIPYIMGIQW